MRHIVLRILDANLNRAREALRVMEEHARFVLDDAALSLQIKNLRHDLVEASRRLDSAGLLGARDTAADVGTAISTPSESIRDGPQDVAAAACKRACEALRCLEEYGKSADAEFARRIEGLRYRAYVVEQALLVTGPRLACLRRARLHVLMTESLCRGPWLDVCRRAIDGGADILQLREKSLPDAEWLRRAQALRELTAARGVLFFVNDRSDIARLVGADGVHVGQDDLSVAMARQVAGPTLLVGRSTHSSEQVREAVMQGADYIAVGPMFEGQTKPDRAVRGPRLLTEALGLTQRPIVAIGGITTGNVTGLVTAANGRALQIAVCQAIIGAEDVEGATSRLRGAMPCDPEDRDSNEPHKSPVGEGER